MDYSPWLQGHHVALPEMLDGREARAIFQQKLLNQWSVIREEHFTLVCFTLNIAGPIKVFALSDEAFAEGCHWIEKGLERAAQICEQKGISTGPVMPGSSMWPGQMRQVPLLQKEVQYRSYGHEAYFVTGCDCMEVKKVLTEIEESHPLGRLFDIDVLRPDGSKVSRQEIGYPSRKCLLCEAMAADCARSRRHTVKELQAHTIEKVLSFIRKKGSSSSLIGQVARMSLLHEVYTTPKPGLVDRANNGSHRDMDVALFEKSAGAIEGYFAECHRTGNQNHNLPLNQLLSKLRPLGIRAEQQMFGATGGVNTHKGMIFSLGIICGAIGWLQGNPVIKLSVKNLLQIAGEIAEPVLDMDFKNLKNAESGENEPGISAQTAGEKQYLAHGISGIRGEAAGGFPSVAQYGLPYFKQCLAEGFSFERAGSLTLLNLIAHVTDTNMIARSNVETQKRLQQELVQQLAGGQYPSQEAIEALDETYIHLNVSPGGCADLLAITYFLWLWEQMITN